MRYVDVFFLKSWGSNIIISCRNAVITSKTTFLAETSYNRHGAGEMMMSLLWFYRPEHTELGRAEEDSPQEVFASKHRDHTSVACIEDKCFVMTFNEYCR